MMVFQPHCRTFLIDKETFKGFLIKIRRFARFILTRSLPTCKKMAL